MRSEEVLEIVKTVGTGICGVMLDPGNAVWVMEDPMHQLEKLGEHVLCTSIRDYRIWESENGATLSWTAIGEGAMDFVKYTELMSERCPGVPLQIEFFAMLRLEDAVEIPINSELKDAAAQKSQEQELIKSIGYLRENCEAIQ